MTTTTMMKTNKIVTLADLRAEKKLTRKRLRQKESDLLASFEDLRNELKPIRIAYRTVTGFFSHDGGLLAKTVGFTVDKIIRQGLLRKAGFITRFAVSFLARNIL